MRVLELINKLKQFDLDKELVFYIKEEYNLNNSKIETILDVDDRIEITVERENYESMDGWW